MTRKLDLSGCWNDVMQLFRTHRELLLSVAGVFILLPGLAFAMFVPPPQSPPDADLTTIYANMQSFYQGNFGWIILIGLLNGFATVVMLVLMLDPSRPSVSEAMRRAFSIILPYYAMDVLSGVLTFLGSLAFILPGIYIFVKLIVAGPVMVAERAHTIIAPMHRSWALTKNNSGRILVFLLVVAVTAFFVYITSVTVFGIVIRLALDGEIAGTLTTLVDAVISMLLTVLMVCVYAGIYRQLAGPGPEDIAREFA